MSGITLDQFRVFAAIVDKGSFSEASRYLNKTQSAVTYAIQKLESQTGLPLFDRENYRPTLTQAGQSLLPHARKILADLSDYQRQAERIGSGLEADLRMAISQFVPIDGVLTALGLFHQAFPSVRVTILTLTLQSTEALDNGSIDLAIIPELIPLGPEYAGRNCGVAPIVAVAAPDHPLAQIAGRISLDQMQMHTQIMATSRSASPLKRDYARQSLNVWRVNDLETKRRLILSGVGWGSVPEYLAAEDLKAGRLVALDPEEWDGRDRMPVLNIIVAHRRDHILGPAGQWLFEQIGRSMA